MKKKNNHENVTPCATETSQKQPKKYNWKKRIENSSNLPPPIQSLQGPDSAFSNAVKHSRAMQTQSWSIHESLIKEQRAAFNDCII